MFQNFNIVEILKQFSKGQKLFVLIFLAIIISGTYLLTNLFTSDNYSCRAVIKENQELLSDYIEISKTIREYQKEKNAVVERITVGSSQGDTLVPPPVLTKNESNGDELLDKILEITEKQIGE